MQQWRARCRAHALAQAPLLVLMHMMVVLVLHPPGRVQCRDLENEQYYNQREAELRAKIDRHKGDVTVDVVNARLELATVLHALNFLHPDGGSRAREAEALYRFALDAISPKDATRAAVHANLGALLIEVFRPEDALIEIDKAIELGAAHGSFFNRAKALGILGRIEEADAAYTQVALSAHGADLASFAKSTAGAEHMTDELLDLVRATVVEASERAAAVRRGGKRDGSSGSGSDGHDWLAAPTEQELSWLNFAMFKALHHRKQYVEAFEALARGNQLMKASLPVRYDAKAEVHHLNVIMSVFDGSLKIAGGYVHDSPIFVVGLPRSGSTLVESILASHSQVWGAGEDTVLLPLAAEFNRLAGQPGFGSATMNSLGKRYVDAMMEMVPTGVPRPARIVDKMLRNLWHVGYINLLLPRAKVLHVMRHPLDAGLSCYQQPFSGNSLPWAWDLVDIAHQINLTIEAAQHWDRVLPGMVKTVLYEELVVFPRDLAAELLAFVGLPWEDGVMDFHKAERTVATASVAQVRKPMYNTSVSRWRRYEAQLEPLITALGSNVKAYEDRLEAVLARRAKQTQAAHEEL